jgi:benzoyl-CoA reductase/2-hydroxyglutaryl-CoA dehydratase subunit BcrC/BadD/HgdB
MGKKKSVDDGDITRLKSKIAERAAVTEKTLGNVTLRSLRKRLKRAQRKRRALAVRLAHARGKKSEAKPAAAAG